MSENKSDFAKQFKAAMDGLSLKHERAGVFSDFLTLAICSYHHVNIQSRLTHKDEENENCYLNIVNKYERPEIEIFPKMLAILNAQVLKEPYSDILGGYYTNEISKGHNGQYFTPDALCDLMAGVVMDIPKDTLNETVLDPTCGSGRMLLRTAKVNPKNLFYGADNNNTCAKMSTINCFLNGLRGEIAWMNTLSMEWYGGWAVNAKGVGIKPIEKEQSYIWTPPPVTKPKPSQENQLTLF